VTWPVSPPRDGYWRWRARLAWHRHRLAHLQWLADQAAAFGDERRIIRAEKAVDAEGGVVHRLELGP
jgi:hypothetical protein